LGEFQWVGKKWPTKMQLARKDIFICRGCVAFQVSEVVLLSTHMLGVIEWGQEGAYSSEWVPGYNGRPPTLQPRWNDAWDANYEQDLSDWRMERGRYQKEKFEWKPYWWREEEKDVSAWKEAEPDVQQWDEEFVEAQKRVLDWSKADWTKEETWEEWEKFLDKPGNTVFNPINLTLEEEEGLEEYVLRKEKDCTLQ
jgi:hypothetical protein